MEQTLWHRRKNMNLGVYKYIYIVCTHICIYVCVCAKTFVSCTRKHLKYLFRYISSLLRHTCTQIIRDWYPLNYIIANYQRDEEAILNSQAAASKQIIIDVSWSVTLSIASSPPESVFQFCGAALSISLHTCMWMCLHTPTHTCRQNTHSLARHPFCSFKYQGVQTKNHYRAQCGVTAFWSAGERNKGRNVRGITAHFLEVLW